MRGETGDAPVSDGIAWRGRTPTVMRADADPGGRGWTVLRQEEPA